MLGGRAEFVFAVCKLRRQSRFTWSVNGARQTGETQGVLSSPRRLVLHSKWSGQAHEGLEARELTRLPLYTLTIGTTGRFQATARAPDIWSSNGTAPSI